MRQDITLSKRSMQQIHISSCRKERNMSVRKGKVPRKSLLLNTEDDEEVDEPIAGGGDLLLAAQDAEDEEDEPLNIPNGVDASEDADEKVVLLANEEDEEEVDEPLPPSIPTSTEVVSSNILQNSSTEFMEALTAISSDCWDISSWIIYYEEVQRGRGGDVTIIEAYERIINQFPRSARFWKNLIEYYLQRGETEQAEETFKKCLSKCRNIDLWKMYLSHLSNAFIDTMRLSKPIEQHNQARAKCELAFEEAMENIGLALGAFPLWRAYIDFVKSWPETGMIESGKKLHMLRHVYQRAVCVAMEQSDDIWGEYEAFEKVAGEQSAEMILPEFNRKYLHAKSVAKERKKLVQHIVFDRLATPPTNSQSELQQLEYWSLWISYEMSGPDYLNHDAFVPMVRMVYEQCLCCFRFNPEVWISAAQFEQHALQRRAEAAGVGTSAAAALEGTVSAEAQVQAVNQARNVLVEAIEANPGVTLLRCALAELEEGAGKLEAAKEVLRVTFEQNPSGFSFALFQRFIRRNLGITAARLLFSETQHMRKSNATLALELALANAKLELEVNCSPQIALNVLNMAQRANPLCLKDSLFIQTISRVLTLLGDLKQLRWIFQSALSEFNSDANQSVSNIAVRGRNGHHPHGRNRSGQSSSAAGVVAGASNHAALKAELELWEEYLRAETMLGLSDIARLNELRERRDRVKLAFEEAERHRLGIVFSSKEEARAAQRGIFHPAQDLSDRYDSKSGCTVWTLPEADRAVQERCGLVLGTVVDGRTASGPATKRTRGGDAGLAALAGRTRTTAGDREVLNMSTEFHLSLAGLPVILRDLLAKLPFHSGPAPDVDGFVRHMKSVILPPRPAPEENSPVEETDLAMLSADGETSYSSLAGAAPGWLGKHAHDDADVDADDTPDAPLANGLVAARGAQAAAGAASVVNPDEDVFRLRKRTRKA